MPGLRPILSVLLRRPGGASNLPWLFNGAAIPVTMSETPPMVTEGVPRSWLRFYPDLPDQRVGNMWKARLYKQWGHEQTIAYAEPPSIGGDGRLRARCIAVF
jgi:hypothetical protein